jgi:hypothetical protein
VEASATGESRRGRQTGHFSKALVTARDAQSDTPTNPRSEITRDKGDSTWAIFFEKSQSDPQVKAAFGKLDEAQLARFTGF